MDNEFDDDVACSLLFMSFDFHFQPTVGLITFPGMRRPRVCMPASLRSFFTVSGVRRDLSLDRWRVRIERVASVRQTRVKYSTFYCFLSRLPAKALGRSVPERSQRISGCARKPGLIHGTVG